MKEDKKNVGFFCSLPMCIIMTYFVLPVGLILIFLRLYKKEKISKKTRNTSIGIIAAITAFVVLLLCVPTSPDNSEQQVPASSSFDTNETTGPSGTTIPSTAETTIPQETTSTTVPTEANTSAKPIVPEDAHKEIEKVLLGTVPLLNQETGKTQYLDQSNVLCGTTFDSALSAVQFAAVDFDQDGTFEAVVELTDNRDGWMLVLRYYDGTVYGYGFAFRAMTEIHTNGVVFGSSGALDSDRYVLQFNKAEVSTSSANSQVAEGEIVWYDFTQTNISGVWKDPSTQGYVDPLQREYDQACNLLANGDYNSALSIFESLNDYKDSKRHVDGIRCINYAKQVSRAITTQFYSLRLVGMNVYCEYSPENYTFSVTMEVPEAGLFGILSSMGVAAGEEITWSQEGCETLAEEAYYDYFMPEGYTGIICEYNIRDIANDTYLTGTYAIRDDEVGIQAYG